MHLPAPRPGRRRSTSASRVAVEVSAGLLLGVLGGYLAGLVRVRTPGGAA